MNNLAPIISYQNAYLGYRNKTVLENVNFVLKKGCFTAIVGMNGSGKTTLFKNILGITSLQKGERWASPLIKWGYVPQRDNLDILFPLTAQEVVAMPLYTTISWYQRLTKNHKEKVTHVLQQVDLETEQNTLFRNLSGGQRQRVLLARALVNTPNVLVLDEPTSGMDFKIEQEVFDLLKKYQAQHQINIIVISHNLNIVLKYAENIGILHNNKITFGKVEEMITVEKLQTIFSYDKIKIVDVEDQKIVLGVP